MCDNKSISSIPGNPEPLCIENAAQRSKEHLKSIPPFPGSYHGRGIVTCAGGPKYYPAAWVLIKMLRKLGCRLPIQSWYLGQKERDSKWISLVEPLGVECVDAFEIRKINPHPRLGGWQCKSYAILHSPFEEVLFLDADNVPVQDPTFLFDDPRYRATGSIFWPDKIRTPKSSPRWKIFGVPYRDEWEQESGQILINKKTCWKTLNLCDWYNRNSGFYYQHIHGDKDTFRFAWHSCGQAFSTPKKAISKLRHTVCQHDLDGRRLFQHRCLVKWSLDDNPSDLGSMYQSECQKFIEEFRKSWQPSTEPKSC